LRRQKQSANTTRRQSPEFQDFVSENRNFVKQCLDLDVSIDDKIAESLIQQAIGIGKRGQLQQLG
jgi:hypothetical protein